MPSLAASVLLAYCGHSDCLPHHTPLLSAAFSGARDESDGSFIWIAALGGRGPTLRFTSCVASYVVGTGVMYQYPHMIRL